MTHFGDDPFGGDHLFGEHDHGAAEDHTGTDHLGLTDDAMGADHDAGYHDAGYHETGPDESGSDESGPDDSGYDHAGGEHDAGQHGDDPLPAEEPAGVPDHGHLLAEHPADAEVGQLDHPDTLPHPVDSSPFPPHLEVDVSPADGQDWVDPAHLGEPEPAFVATTEPPETLLAGLQAAEGADPAASDDPAIRALALFWSR